MAKAVKFTFIAIALIATGLAGYLRFAPPDLLRVGTNYAAKVVCSSVFISSRDADEVLRVDVQAPGHPLLGYVSVSVDQAAQSVSARLFGFAAHATAQYRAGLGCANLHDTDLSDATVTADLAAPDGSWPQGNDVSLSQDPAISAILSDPALLGDGYRAIVVVKDGQIIGETYAAGFSPDTPLLGWSMTKTVTAAIIGSLIQAGEMSLDDPLTGSFAPWDQDARAGITVRDMLAMSSGLEWNEGYGNVSDVTRMLYLSDDMAGFASGKPLDAAIGTAFTYSSGTSTILSRVWQDRVGQTALTYPRAAIFGPLGMTSAVLEADAADTFVGSSYMYATARDWARFGQFLLQGGTWNGAQILPEGFTDWMVEPVESANGAYARGHLWREAASGQPPFEDAVWLRGHDGQWVGVFPSRDLVLVRLGLTPSRLGYSPLPLARALVAALGDGA
ncbi:serine hydrolase domain-containing protein [Yoonia sp.]|uniref:serine hydrolase domain-containing protein n=1 Tax=Yoonia sp. TaxID=2212373 RepID=UPI002FDB4521